MNVTISVAGRHHAFDLARELDRRGHLRRLITSYPTFAVRRHGVPPERVASLWLHEAAKRLWERWPSALRPAVDMRGRLSAWFDRASARRIPEDTDVFVGWSGGCERGLERARELGSLAVVERGSAHVDEQREILSRESELQGVGVRLPHPDVAERERREYERADVISVPSRFAATSFLERGFDPDRVLRVPYGVDVDLFRPAEDAGSGDGEAPGRDPTPPARDADAGHDEAGAPFRVIYAGRMSLQKGVHYLLEAFDGLELPDAELWLLGRRRPEIDPWFRRYRGAYRHFGHVPQHELPRYYRRGSVFVLNSVHDGFGMVILQAMACGLPVVATEHTGGPDVLRDGEDGFVIPVRDPDALAERLRWCHAHRQRCREMGRSARERVVRSFRWSDYGARIAEAYRSRLPRAPEAGRPPR